MKSCVRNTINLSCAKILLTMLLLDNYIRSTAIDEQEITNFLANLLVNKTNINKP